jgi:hypothetical protein
VPESCGCEGKEKESVYDGVEEPITCRTKDRWFEKGST